MHGQETKFAIAHQTWKAFLFPPWKSVLELRAWIIRWELTQTLPPNFDFDPNNGIWAAAASGEWKTTQTDWIMKDLERKIEIVKTVTETRTAYFLSPIHFTMAKWGHYRSALVVKTPSPPCSVIHHYLAQCPCFPLGLDQMLTLACS